MGGAKRECGPRQPRRGAHGGDHATRVEVSRLRFLRLTGPWDTPGSERTVLLEDGSTAHEHVLTWECPQRFEYRVDRLSSPLGRLVDHALGSWEFSATERGSRFLWTYSFTSRRRLSAALLRPFTATAWARYMGQCAEECVELAHSGE